MPLLLLFLPCAPFAVILSDLLGSRVGDAEAASPALFEELNAFFLWVSCTLLVEANFRGWLVPEDELSADGGDDAFETTPGSGEAVELEFTPWPQPSLEGLG